MPRPRTNTSVREMCQKAEDADQQALREVASVCFSGTNLDDAIASVVVDRVSPLDHARLGRNVKYTAEPHRCFYALMLALGSLCLEQRMACYVFAWIVVPSLATSSLLEAVLHLQCPCSHYAIMKSYTPAIKRKGRDSGGGADAGQQEKPRTGEQSGCIDGVCKVSHLLHLLQRLLSLSSHVDADLPVSLEHAGTWRSGRHPFRYSCFWRLAPTGRVRAAPRRRVADLSVLRFLPLRCCRWPGPTRSG